MWEAVCITTLQSPCTHISCLISGLCTIMPFVQNKISRKCLFSTSCWWARYTSGECRENGQRQSPFTASRETFKLLEQLFINKYHLHHSLWDVFSLYSVTWRGRKNAMIIKFYLHKAPNILPLLLENNLILGERFISSVLFSKSLFWFF